MSYTDHRTSSDSIRDMGETLKLLRDDVRESATKLRDDLRDLAKGAGCEARKYVDSSGQVVSNAGGTLVSKFQQKPLQYTLAAVGIGVVLGMLCKRH